jgi:hypothetical protein
MQEVVASARWVMWLVCVLCWQPLAVMGGLLQELYSHYTQQVKDTSVSLSDPHKAYLLRKAMHFFNTRLKYRPNIDNYPSSKPVIQVRQLQRCWQPTTHGEECCRRCLATATNSTGGAR